MGKFLDKSLAMLEILWWYVVGWPYLEVFTDSSWLLLNVNNDQHTKPHNNNRSDICHFKVFNHLFFLQKQAAEKKNPFWIWH